MSLYNQNGSSVFHNIKTSLHVLSETIRSMAISKDFEEAMRKAENDSDTKAFLMSTPWMKWHLTHFLAILRMLSYLA